MRLRISQIPVKLDYEKPNVLAAVARLLNCREDELDRLVLLRRSIDARGMDAQPRFVLSVEVDYLGEAAPPLVAGRVELAVEPEPTPVIPHLASRKHRPMVVGAGPAGLMAALTLAEAGWKPLLIERGADVLIRSHQVETFRQDGVLNLESNVLYGEGGAGLFSDGKLTARSKDRGAIRQFFELLVDCGASSDILIDAEPHLGSDVLSQIIPTLRKRICELGGEVWFGKKLDGLHIEDGALRGVTVSGEEITTDTCLLATGHSARDVYAMLAEVGVPLAAKPFAVGLRAEMPQSRLNVAQYGRWATHPRLGSAGFRLTRKPGQTTRGCYSFCNCPGGLVMACASSDGMLTTNGMSYSSRAKPFGNAAFLVPVGPNDYPAGLKNADLAGVGLQRTMERTAFLTGGGDYGLPAQPLIDFLEDREPTGIPEARSCTRAVPADVARLLPDEVARTLRSTLPKMLRELNGIRHEDVLLYGVETRSSSPVRISRDSETSQSTGVRGLYPIGEGSGYAGGIVSSALDGMSSARRALQSAT
jgi:uncharacterized FAD-dependent dehydrogenase